MFTQFYVLGPRGDSIISRNLRNEIAKSTVEIFFRNVRFWNNQTQDAPPVFNVDGLHYLWLKRNGLYFVLTATENVSPAVGMELLVRITKLMKDYCGMLTEEAVRANFTLVYEVMDEVLDYGYPQSTTNDSLKPFVFNEPVSLYDEKLGFKNPFASTKTSSAQNVTKSIISKDRSSNDVYVDIYENVSITFDSAGVIRTQSIDGNVQVKSYLAGSPDLCLNFDNISFNNRVAGKCLIADANFHECADAELFETQGRVVFRPREGEFNLMNYRVATEFRAPIRIFPFFEMTSAHRAEFVLKVRTDFPTNTSATALELVVPIPALVSSISCSTSSQSQIEQSAQHEPGDRLVRWRLTKIQGGMEASLHCRCTLVSASDASLRRHFGPIMANFEIPMFSASGISANSLELLDRGQPPNRWVRYITKSNSYSVRM